MNTSKFLDCVVHKKITHPIWFFRQAGRYLPEYRALREKRPNFLKFCYTPELCIEAVMQPIWRFDFDAAIVFSDILVIPNALGQTVEFEEGIGPRLQSLNRGSLLEGLTKKHFTQRLAPVYEAVCGMVESLKGRPLIGFSGSPWTLACYMIEGQGSRDFFQARKSARHDPGFSDLIALLEESIAEHLIGQINAGASVVQLFDSWAGVLSPDLFERYVIEPTKRIVRAIKCHYPEIPIMGFARGSGMKNLQFTEKTGLDVVALDETIDLDTFLKFADDKGIFQGNLDPICLFMEDEILAQKIENWKTVTMNRPWIYNLGHGVHKDTNPEKVQFIIDCLRK